MKKDVSHRDAEHTEELKCFGLRAIDAHFLHSEISVSLATRGSGREKGYLTQSRREHRGKTDGWF